MTNNTYNDTYKNYNILYGNIDYQLFTEKTSLNFINERCTRTLVQLQQKLKTMRGLFSNNSARRQWENAGARRNLVYELALKSLAAGNEHRITVILSPTPTRDLLS